MSGYIVRVTEQTGEVHRVLVPRALSEAQAIAEVTVLVEGRVLGAEPYDPEAVVRELVAGGAESRERGRIAARIRQIGHDVAVMAAGTQPDLLQRKARVYLTDVDALQERRAWRGDLDEGRAIITRLEEFHRQLFEAGHGPELRPLDDSAIQ